MALVARRRRRHRPQLVVLADVSGSVATFARFNLRLLYALSSRYQSVDIFAFVDEISDVTKFFRLRQFDAAMAAVNGRATPHGVVGHSDYGHALGRFAGEYLNVITASTTVLVMGDARNNYHPTNDKALAAVADKAKRVVWLNPEPAAYWNTADSLAGAYGAHCEAMYECRNMKQLGDVIAEL